MQNLTSKVLKEKKNSWKWNRWSQQIDILNESKNKWFILKVIKQNKRVFSLYNRLEPNQINNKITKVKIYI